MANLNIPFLLLQPSTCKFEPHINTTKIISYDKYTMPRPSAPLGIPVRDSFHGAGAGIQNIQNMPNQQPRQSEYSHRNQILEENSAATRFEFAKYSTFEDTPRNLIVTSDDQSGSIVLWHQDSFVSSTPMTETGQNHNRISKFIISVVPRVVLTPSISKQVGQLITYCLIKSPAPNILSTSMSLLVTLHGDGILRLWTTDDGRCVLQSQPDQLIPKNVVAARCTIQTLNSGIASMSGIIVLVSSDTKEIYFINAYKMILLKKIPIVVEGSLQGTMGIKSFDRTLMIVDKQRGVIQWFQRDGESTANFPLHNGSNQMRNMAMHSQASSSSSYSPQQQILIDITNAEDSILTSMLNYKLKTTIGFQDYGQMLTFKQLPRDLFVLAKSKAVLTFQNNDSHAILLPERSQLSFIFAKFIEVSNQQFLFLIDSELTLFVYDPLKQKVLYKEKLIKATQIFEGANHSGRQKESITLFNGSSLLVDKEEKNAEKIALIHQMLNKKIQQGGKIFRVNSEERFLYTIAQLQGAQTLITWNLSSLMSNIYAGLSQNHPPLPLNLQPLNIFQSQHDNSFLLNLQPILIRYIYNHNQFSFLYSDEQVTASAIYVSSQHPCYLAGTNYGRIFMLSMFEDSNAQGYDDELHQDRISPILLIDSHNSSPITKLFVAYKSARSVNQDQGGHLISVSEDGTIAVTNLNSGEIHKQIHQYTAQSKEKWNGKRADSFFNERAKNREVKRRNSFSNDFSVANFYHMVKVKSQMVYSYAVGFGQVDKIIEVKNINAMQEQLQQRMKQSSEPAPSIKKFNHEEGYYACISSQGGTVHLLKIINMRIELLQLTGLDTESEVLGIYADTNLNLINVLTQKRKDSRILLYIYNSKSSSLLRRVDHKHAMDILMVKDTLEQIVQRNEGLKGKGASFFDFDGFQSFFKNAANQQHLMGLGSHKLLDYMSLALNLPLEYHPHTAFSAKYTKTMHDLLEVKAHINNVLGLTKPQNAEEVNDSQRIIIRALNEAVYLNNQIYQSDFDEELYTKTSGATCITTAENTFLGSKQHIVIANCKQMLNLHQQRINSQKMKPSSQVPSKNNISPDVQAEDPKFIMKFGNKIEEEKAGYRPLQHLKNQQQSDSEPLAQNKWPTKLLSLLHPFNIEANLDDALERFMGLNIPFLDFRVGLQGAHESFSFVVTREDEDFHYDRQNPIKLIRLLRLSSHKTKMINEVRKEFNIPQQAQVQTLAKSNSKLKSELLQIELEMEALIQSEPIIRFYGSEHWKISSYLSTLLPTFFLSILTGICEYAKDQVTQIMQDWLLILQKINQQRTISDSCRLSLSAASKILLKKDVSISVTSRDLLIKPVLLTLAGTDRMNDAIEEFTAIILDTYKKLKKESTLRSVYGSNSTNQSQATVITTQTNNSQAVQQSVPQQSKLINSFFGELELRGLICLSYFALYNNDQLDVNLRYRVSKLTTILTREVVEKFNNDRRYIHLLTHLLQLLSVWMKAQNNQLNNKAMIGEVIRLLLLIYNMNKQQLNRDNVMMRVTGENFYLIKPTHPELFLKLTAAKALLVISESYTHDFLVMIQEEASHLNQGGDYQQNVLDILKIFINSSLQTAQQESTSTVNLEHHLIQITAILLKCFDPNEPALRKNSHKIVSVILNMLVKMFPMVDFHHESQRLAVGTHEGPIAIYDMRTAMKWKILEGHQGNLTCLAFDSKGNMLASYSAVDRTLQLWKVSSTGFFSTIIGGTSKSTNKIVLPPLKVRNPHARKNLATDANFAAKQDNTRTDNLVQEESSHTQASAPMQASSSKRVNCCYIKFVGPKDKEVDLKREDGNVERIKIVK